MNIDDILAVLPTLSKKDILKLKAALELFSVEEDGWKTLYDSIAKESGDRGIVLPSSSYFRSNSYFKRFREGAGIVDRFIEDNFPEANRISRVKVYRVFAKIFIDYLEDIDNEVNMTNISIFAYRIPSIVDNAFPGYASVGMLSKIIK